MCDDTGGGGGGGASGGSSGASAGDGAGGGNGGNICIGLVNDCDSGDSSGGSSLLDRIFDLFGLGGKKGGK